MSIKTVSKLRSLGGGPLYLDADGDTYVEAPTDDTIEWYIGGNLNMSWTDGEITVLDAKDSAWGTGIDTVLRWSTADASNHALALGLGDSSQALHITDKGAIATDWNIGATTHPNVYIHSNTTPATDYLRLGGHDGTTAYVDVVGGTTLAVQVDGVTQYSADATNLIAIDNNAFAAGAGADSRIYYDGTDTFWDLRAVGTGDLMIALAGSFPSPDAEKVHIWRGSAGVVDGTAVSALVLEDDGDVSLNLLGPNANNKSIQFGEPSSNYRGQLIFRGSGGSPADTFQFDIATTVRMQLNATGLDLLNNSLLNVGAAGNDWTANTLTLSSDNSGGNQRIIVENTSANAASHAIIAATVKGASAGDPKILLTVDGVAVYANGIDASTAAWVWSLSEYLGTNDRMRLASDTGVLSVDGAGAGNGLPTLFDEYDDAAELRTFQMANVPCSMITREQQVANQKRLVEIGVAEWAIQEDGSHHWMMRVQPMNRLLAGGIYQNRQLIDEQAETIAALNERMDTPYKELNRRLQAIGA